jgi:predicted dehydrogenase
MSFFIIGLGSMGKRRIRCLQSLGEHAIVGFDIREDRRKETEDKYQIPTFSSFEDAFKHHMIDAMIIAVPPDVHHVYMQIAADRMIDFFVEASVVDTELQSICRQLESTSIVAAPSATLCFHPAINIIKTAVQSDQIGKVSNILLHSGQYLPDWHVYEKVSDFYVSQKETGGAREIVPFELTWFTKVFGFPSSVCAHVRKTIPIAGAEQIDDTYNVLLDYREFLAVLTIDVVSRSAIRKVLINAERGQIVWDWNYPYVQVYFAEHQQWTQVPYAGGQAEAGYHANIGEQMYVEEMKAFISSIKTGKRFMNTLQDDMAVLDLLRKIELSQERKSFMEISK